VTHGKQLHDRITSLIGKVPACKTSLAPPTYIDFKNNMPTYIDFKNTMPTYIDLKKIYEYEKKGSYKMIQEDGVCSTMPDNTMNSGTCGTFGILFLRSI
jgi:hypothetical protein